MKLKIIIVFFFIFFVIHYAYAKPLKAGISYTVNEARIEAFTNTPNKIDIKKFAQNFSDPNYDKNKNAIKKNKLEFKNRFIYAFSDGTYCITYKDNNKIGYYYNTDGSLYAIDIDINDTYPKKSIGYDINGNIESVILILSEKEQYIFDLNKKLIAHWIGNNGYDENGNLFMTRD